MTPQPDRCSHTLARHLPSGSTFLLKDAGSYRKPIAVQHPCVCKDAAGKFSRASINFPVREHIRWWQDAIIYEAYVDKFAGNFKNFTHQLWYLEKLGVTCIHLLPHYSSPMVDEGYDVSDYRAIREDLGTLEDFSAFVAETERRGMRIIIDLVLNHTSTTHPWFREAQRSSSSVKRDFYLWSKTGKEFADAVNAFKHLKPRNWIYNPKTHDYYFSTFYSEQADLNWDNPEVLKEMLAIMDFWMTLGVSGFRLDAVTHLIKREGTNCKSLPEVHHILKNLRKHVEAVNPEIVLLAEAYDSILKARAYFGDGDECHLAYNFPLMGQMFFALARGRENLVRETLKESTDIPEQCSWAAFLRCHDEIMLTLFPPDTRQEILAYLDPKSNYLFNNGTGTSVRLASIWPNNAEKLRQVFRWFFSMPGSLVWYYGDEIGMENEGLEHAFRDTRLYVRGTFDWNAANAQAHNPDSLFAYVAGLIRERKKIRKAL